MYFLSYVFEATYELGHKMHLLYSMNLNLYHCTEFMCVIPKSYIPCVWCEMCPTFYICCTESLICPCVVFRKFHVFKEAHVKPIEFPTRNCETQFLSKILNVNNVQEMWYKCNTYTRPCCPIWVDIIKKALSTQYFIARGYISYEQRYFKTFPGKSEIASRSNFENLCCLFMQTYILLPFCL